MADSSEEEIVEGTEHSDYANDPKPPINISYETMCLTQTEGNSSVRPAGF